MWGRRMNLLKMWPGPVLNVMAHMHACYLHSLGVYIATGAQSGQGLRGDVGSLDDGSGVARTDCQSAARFVGAHDEYGGLYVHSRTIVVLDSTVSYRVFRPPVLQSFAVLSRQYGVGKALLHARPKPKVLARGRQSPESGFFWCQSALSPFRPLPTRGYGRCLHVICSANQSIRPPHKAQARRPVPPPPPFPPFLTWPVPSLRSTHIEPCWVTVCHAQ
jgi:hypothetical protein